MNLLVVSDIHYAAAGEQARRGHEARAIGNAFLRGAARAWRRWVWLRDPLAHNHRIHHIVAANPRPDWVVANGDFSLDTGFVGVSDDAAFASAEEALRILRTAYGTRLRATLGDHELGKKSLFGGAGGLRLASWERSLHGLQIPPSWHLEFGSWVLIGAASTPLALPVFQDDARPEELADWKEIAHGLRSRIRELFAAVRPDQRIVLFVHDPSALPFLAREPEVQRRMPQIAATVVGHLHTNSIFRLGSALAGFPTLRFCGHTARRYSSALGEARWWREFRTVLCPSPTGIELLKDGGWLQLELSEDGSGGLRLHRHRLPWQLTAEPIST